MNVARKLVDCLVAEGVEYVFGIPGEENLEVIEALASSPIRFITTRHEQGAAFMAAKPAYALPRSARARPT